MLYRIIILFLLIFSLNIYAAPRLDCHDVKPQFEKLICRDKKLIGLDNELVTYYTLLSNTLILTSKNLSGRVLDNKAVDEQFHRLAKEQLSWITKRSHCHNKQCLQTIYTARLKQLKNFARSNYPSIYNSHSYAEAIKYYIALHQSIVKKSSAELDQSDFLQFPLLIANNNRLFILSFNQWQRVFPLLFPQNLITEDNWSVGYGFNGNGPIDKAGIIVGKTPNSKVRFIFQQGNLTTIMIDSLPPKVLTLLQSFQTKSSSDIIGTYVNEGGTLYIRRTPTNKIIVRLSLMQENMGDFSGIVVRHTNDILIVKSSDKNVNCGFSLRLTKNHIIASISNYSCQNLGANVSAEGSYIKIGSVT